MSSRHCVGTRVTKYYMSLILDTFFIFQIKILKQNTKNNHSHQEKHRHEKNHRTSSESSSSSDSFKMSSSDLSICVPDKNRTVGPTKLHSKPTTRSLEQVKHPHNPVKETFEAFCTSAAQTQTLPGSSQLRRWLNAPRHTLLPPPISTEPSGGDTAPETKSRLKLGRVSDSYHGY